ncbi:MAG: hypothetical protein WC011_00150 [Candidatus Paceibacterota bacterium]
MLTHNQILESSVIFIEFEDSNQDEPYLVVKKSIGTISEAMMLLGFKFSDLFKYLKSNIEFNPFTDTSLLDRFYIKYEKDGSHKGVKCYRKITESEKVKISNELDSFELFDKKLQEVIFNS